MSTTPEAGRAAVTPHREQAITGRPPRLRPDDWKRINWQSEISRNGLEGAVADAVAIVRRLPHFFPNCTSIPLDVLLHEQATELRNNLMTGSSWVMLMSTPALQPQVTELLLQEFLEYLNRLDPEQAAELVEEVCPVNREWLAPRVSVELRLELEGRKHKAFLSAARAVPRYRPYRATLFTANEAYGASALTADDWRLADEWAKGNSSDYERAKMISARAAEKVAIRFYERLGFTTQDVSIEQLNGGYGDWITHDILVGDHSVDVKNSRRPNSVSGYSEHAVNRVKLDRRNRDVTITGVYSPYLQLKYLEDPAEIPEYWHTSVQVLGECTRPMLEDLRREFTSPTLLHELGIDRGHRGGEFLPPWVFNYPEAFYDQEDGQAYREAVAEFVRQDPPSWEAAVYHHAGALSYYVQTATPLPAAWHASLQPWELVLADRIMGGRARSSLPHLFLTILTDFLAALQEERSGYDPIKYYRLLYRGFDYHAWAPVPLGIYDPTQSVWSLLSTFRALWEHREKSRLLEFKRFEFTAAGLLRGTRPGDAKRISLLAWCGGPRCNVSDLVLGVQDACLCGYLICPQCGFCRDNCETGALRRAEGEKD